MGMASISGDEDTILQRVPLRNALSNIICRVSIDRFPFHVVRAEDFVGHMLDFGLGCRGRKPLVFTSFLWIDLDIDADAVVTLRDDHTGTPGGTNGTLNLHH